MRRASRTCAENRGATERRDGKPPAKPDGDARPCRRAERGRRAEDLRHVAGGLAGARRRRCARRPGRDRGATIPARLLGVLLDTMPNLGCSDVPLMPFPAREALVRTIVPAMSRQPEFSRAPTWDGTPVETGALARMRSQPLVAALAARDGNSVATRMTARLAELATLLQDWLRAPTDERSTSGSQAMALAPGEGLGAVQTARGLLLHRVRLADGRVAHYQIVAPTEWNFHSDGRARARSARARHGRRRIARAAGATRRAGARPVRRVPIEVGHA